MIKHSDGLAEKQIRLSKLVTESVGTKNNKIQNLRKWENVLNTRNRSQRQTDRQSDRQYPRGWDSPRWLKCKIRGGKRYIQVWSPDNGCMPFPSIITIWGGGNALSHKLEVGERLSLVSHCTFTTDSPPGWHPCYIACRTSPRQKCVDIAILLRELSGLHPRIIRNRKWCFFPRPPIIRIHSHQCIP